MSYWCDDRRLLIEQRRLDAAQAEAAKKIEEAKRRRSALEAIGEKE